MNLETRYIARLSDMIGEGRNGSVNDGVDTLAGDNERAKGVVRWNSRRQEASQCLHPISMGVAASDVRNHIAGIVSVQDERGKT
jgi:hypothetical protein